MNVTSRALWTAVCVLSAFTGSRGDSASGVEPLTHATTLEIRAHPANYDGKLVVIVGVLAIGFEMQNVYASRNDYGRDVYGSCLSVALTDKEQRRVRGWNNVRVRITGRVRERICPNDHVCLGYCSISGIEAHSIVRMRS